MKQKTKLQQQIKVLYMRLLGFLLVFLFLGIAIPTCLKNPKLFLNDSKQIESTTDYVEIQEEDFDKIENGIHVRTGFVAAEGLMETVNNCTNCHSSELVLQNRMSKERWIATIRWMQETQNLWNLGKNEAIIVNYLVTNYPAKVKGRRAPLTKIQWYDLKD